MTEGATKSGATQDSGQESCTKYVLDYPEISHAVQNVNSIDDRFQPRRKALRGSNCEERGDTPNPNHKTRVSLRCVSEDLNLQIPFHSSFSRLPNDRQPPSTSIISSYS